jgi:hypothetical protein
MLVGREAGLRNAVIGAAGLVLGLGTVAGCVSYWDLRRGEELPYGCTGELLWFPDADADEWGDPGTSGEPSCGPITDQGRTASNALDCDDSDPGITGRVGSICPDQMAFLQGGTPCVEGIQVGNSELVATCGGSPPVFPDPAAADCGHWSSWDTSLGSDAPQPINLGLAALETEPESNAVTTWLAEAGEPRAVWVDLRWVGSIESGTWQWPDGTAPTWIPACGAQEPVPADFFPHLVAGTPEGDATLQDSLRYVRLALIFDGTSWCRGVPPEAYDEATDTTFAAAHALCERPRPVLADYAVEPDADSEQTTPGVGQ